MPHNHMPTVKEVIEHLSQFDENLPVLRHGRGDELTFIEFDLFEIYSVNVMESVTANSVPYKRLPVQQSPRTLEDGTEIYQILALP